MAPKPIPQNALMKAELDAKAMPPPPLPAPQMSILEPEMNALEGCLKNAAVKFGQILRFHSDTQRLHIRKHISAPPISLTASLGRELELYDQLCELVESHLLRAISILQRDLQQEQLRIKEAEAVALAAQIKDGPMSPTSSRGPLPTEDLASEATQPNDVASNPSQSPSVPLGRRPSVISISSLHRPTLPPKLDLSSTSLRLSGEEAGFLSSGLHSPVTLAPRSARPTDYTDLMSAFAPSADTSHVDMDLTLPDSDASNNMNLDVGSSADKPIELDMEGMDTMDMAMTDLFGDTQETISNDNDVVEGLFSPIEGPSEASGKLNKEDTNFLSSLGVGTGSNADDIFSSLQSASDQPTERNGDSLQIPLTNAEAAPSPGTLIASLSENPVPAPSTENSDGGQPFDFGFLTHDSLGEFWDMGGGEQGQSIVGPMNQESSKS
ncbi:hypothetical protein E1B28_009816 [Marasmius oreades]|uniref:Uncharacterized protein n=1 Tax=Marasmius oreades TaxID=181124 RepID=A0A9P7UT11_9AGAR|nr:uncharacterized protein E1B28_009816 [Marasmius oreades]KAG7090724.1 hypothetical protein E1B28_009816 [Marasmius oreades]